MMNSDKYLLQKKDPKNQEKYKVTIVGDSNDADYITTIEYYTQSDFDEYVIDGLSRLKRDYSGRHQLEDFQSQEDYIAIPFNGYGGNCHSLESLTVEYMDKNNTLWDVYIFSYRDERE